ncbi:MAG TPA: hypothetical protein VFE85_08175 [Woeseiaceae bacterium]|nr:hypothetical protein [Woeseiaceae bacterium]
MKVRGTASALSLIALSTVLSSTAQLVFRFVMQHYELFSTAAILPGLSTADLLLLLAGIALYAISMLAWVFVLSRFDVSFAYPLMSISYLLVFLGAVKLPFFNEALSSSKLVAIVLIVAGVAMLSYDEKTSARKKLDNYRANR